MMKKLLFTLTLTFSIFINAQQSYYNDVNLTLTGTDLRDALATKIISTHTNVLGYGWGVDQATDVNPNDATKVFLIYGWENGSDSDCTNDLERGINNNGGNNCDWNREHVYPKSLGTPSFVNSSTPGADGHHIRASDVQRNGSRSNKLFIDGSGNSGSVSTGWYPGDEWKGDVARIIMYMYLRYGSQCLPSNVGIGSVNSVDSNMIDLFLEWNAADPVSAIEDQRNNYLENTSNTYGQGNRNPFIDNPYLATLIWGGSAAEDRWGISTPDSEAPTVPTNISTSNITSNSVTVSWNASTDNVAVSSYEVFVNGISNSSTSSTSINISSLTPNTTYTFTVRASDIAGNNSAQSSGVMATTLEGGSGSSNELFISEYVEGGSNNKAIEIANFTGSTVDLSSYSLQRNVNGGTTWDGEITLSGNLADGDVFVIRNNSATLQKLIDEADISSSLAAVAFNGNDPVGLFKNGTLIDIVGTYNGGSANFAINVTLRRKNTITSPSTTFDLAGEWDSYSQDTVDNIGIHSVATASIEDDLLSEIKVYPNPSISKTIFITEPNSIQIKKISIYSVIGKEIYKNNNPVFNSNRHKIDILNSGIYLLKISSEKGSTTKKVIIR